MFVTGEKPQWIVGDEKYDVRSYGLKQAAWSFGRTTHLGGKGEYFIRIEDVSPSRSAVLYTSPNRMSVYRVGANPAEHVGHFYLLLAPITQH